MHDGNIAGILKDHGANGGKIKRIGCPDLGKHVLTGDPALPQCPFAENAILHQQHRRVRDQVSKAIRSDPRQREHPLDDQQESHRKNGLRKTPPG